jgi:AGCS family alanine or glycine:cation symporter
MAFPNLVALILLSGIVSKETKDYLERLHNGKVGD